MKIADGYGYAPMEPGIGIDWDWDKVKKLSIAEFDTTITA
jgi:L-alanine-DL-glutamate epimerase-like enolase superfamily enzyme